MRILGRPVPDPWETTGIDPAGIDRPILDAPADYPEPCGLGAAVMILACTVLVGGAGVAVAALLVCCFG